jgi:phage replication O-like protein O
MSLFRNLIHAAIQADFGKNSFKVFSALLQQTLGYGKEKDPLTDKRLAYLSGVRLDRVRPAIEAVLKTGIFERAEAKRYDWCYCIGAEYLAEHEKACKKKYPDKAVQFFTPALPKNRENSQKTEELSENQRHTSFDLNPFLSHLQPLLQLLTPAPAITTESLTESICIAMNSALQPLVQNLQTLNTSQYTQNKAENPAAIRVSSPVNKANTASAKSKKTGGGENNKKNSNSQINANVEDSHTESSPVQKHSEKQTETSASTIASKKRLETASPTQTVIDDIETQQIALQNTAKPIEIVPSIDSEKDSDNTFQPIDNIMLNTLTDIVQQAEKPVDLPKEPALAKIKLPAIIEKTAYGRCYKALDALSEEQQHSVLAVFTEMQQQNKIHTSATGLFINLAHTAASGGLSSVEKYVPVQAVFKGDPEHSNIQWGYSQSPQNDVSPPISAEEQHQVEVKAEQYRQREQYIEDHGQLETLMFHCRAANISIEEQAKIYHLEHILAQFPKEVVAFKKRLKGKST